jgi:hypothetical protein
MPSLLFEPQPGFSLFCASILKRLILLPRALKFVRASIVVSDANMKNPVRIIYLGGGETLPYLREALGNASSTEERFLFTPMRLRRLIEEAIGNKEMAIVELNRLLSLLLPSGGIVSYPWIRQRVLLAGSEYQLRKRKIENTYGRRVRKNHYECEPTRDLLEIRRFYDAYYIPHLERRFGRDIHTRSFAELRHAARAGFLMKIFHNGKWVAGAMCREGRGRLTAMAFGINWDEENEWRLGAMSAVYYYLFRWAEQHSIDEVDLLRSRPLATDGVFIHKSRWGAIPVADPWPHTQISFYFSRHADMPAAIRSFLVRNGRKFVQIQDYRRV